MESRGKKPSHPIYWTLGVILLCIIWLAVTPIYSDDGDNYSMALVVNRMFTGEGQDVYVNYLNPLLCLIFQVVLCVLPMADCFTLSINLMLLFAVGVIAYLIAVKSKNYYELLGYYSVFLAVIILPDLFHYNFTAWAAFLSAAGMLVLLLLIHKKLEGKRWSGIALTLLALGLMWRSEAFLIFVPFICLDIGIQVLFVGKTKEERKELLQHVIRVLAIPAFCLVVLGMLHVGVLHSGRYQEAKAYDDVRSAVLDYPLKRWHDIQEQIPEISENDYYTVLWWNLMDTDRIDTQFLFEMLEAGEKEIEEPIGLGYIWGMQKSVIRIFLSTKSLQYFTGIAIMMFGSIMLSKLKWYYKLQTVFAYVGTDLICLFFVYAGRALERVFILTIYALLASLLVLLLAETEHTRKGFHSLARIAVTAVGVFGVAYGVMHTEYAPEQSVFKAKNCDSHTYDLTYSDDELYFWDVFAYIDKPMEYFTQEGKLMPTEYMEHNIYNGSWTYGQVYFEQFLEKIGAENPMTALLERENTYYVSEEYLRELTYLQENYNENVIVEQVKEIEGVPVWKFSISEGE